MNMFVLVFGGCSLLSWYRPRLLPVTGCRDEQALPGSARQSLAWHSCSGRQVHLRWLPGVGAGHLLPGGPGAGPGPGPDSGAGSGVGVGAFSGVLRTAAEGGNTAALPR